MSTLGELLAVNHKQAFMFFHDGLQDVVPVEHRRRVGDDEFAYTASILSHYAQVSQGSGTDLPLPLTLRDWFFRFIFDTTVITDPEVIETGAAQCLVLTGFFAEGMARRHNIDSYSQWGSEMFRMAAVGRKQSLMTRMGLHFDIWRGGLERLHKECQAQAHLVQFNQRPQG